MLAVVFGAIAAGFFEEQRQRDLQKKNKEEKERKKALRKQVLGG